MQREKNDEEKWATQRNVNTIKDTNICIMGLLEEGKRKGQK